MKVKGIVDQITTRYGTNDPIEIASQKQIHIFYEEFKNIWGYYNSSRRIEMIHINRNLDEPMRRFVIAHELGHRYLHPKVNVPFLRAHTLQSVDKLERQANQFAVELLMPDKLLIDGLSIYEAARISGIPKEVAHLKRKPRIRC